ncbi:MAG: hypothetical protein CMJ94_09655 [Planctomycetes bacterium]|nr:hypothetical protein [Planctomycetota bacterium]
MADWSFRSRQGLCAACGRGFVEGEAVFSMLRLIEDELQRGDLCSNCFDRRDEASDLIWWRTAHQEKKGGLRMDFDLVLSLFDKLGEQKKDGVLDLRFLLALLLVRHRKLRLTGVRVRGKREYLQLRKPRTKKEYEAEVRELEAERRARLTTALGELMDPTADGGGMGDLLAALEEPIPPVEDAEPAAEAEPAPSGAAPETGQAS